MRNWTSAGLLFVAASAFGQGIVSPILPPAGIFASTSGLPPVGLAVSETVQVNVVNTATASSSGTAASCGGTIAFYNARGAIIGTATSFTVTTGQVASVSLPYASASAAGSRTVVRAVITNQVTIAGFGIPPCSLAYSMETYDTATGVTHAFVSGPVTQSLWGVLQSVVPPPSHP